MLLGYFKFKTTTETSQNINHRNSIFVHIFEIARMLNTEYCKCLNFITRMKFCNLAKFQKHLYFTDGSMSTRVSSRFKELIYIKKEIFDIFE